MQVGEIAEVSTASGDAKEAIKEDYLRGNNREGRVPFALLTNVTLVVVFCAS